MSAPASCTAAERASMGVHGRAMGVQAVFVADAGNCGNLLVRHCFEDLE